jgi:aryl carrier-like protein
MKIGEVPLTINGKVDKKKLPEPELVNEDRYVAPRDEIEEKLSEIWSDVLGIERGKIGIYDNFFRLGGDSIISIQIISKAKKKGVLLKVRDIFNNPTIHELSKVIASNDSVLIDIKAEQNKVLGEVKMLPIQQEFFYNKSIKEKSYYNQSVMLSSRVALDTYKITKVIERIIEHHDLLRAQYHRVIEDKDVINWKQIINERGKYMYREVNLQNKKEDEVYQTISKISQEIQSDLDIEKGRLMGVVLYHCPIGIGDRLFIVIQNLNY